MLLIRSVHGNGQKSYEQKVEAIDNNKVRMTLEIDKEIYENFQKKAEYQKCSEFDLILNAITNSSKKAKKEYINT